MHETVDDLERLQQVLDRTYAGGGRHLLDVIPPERRLDAGSLVAKLDGMRLLVLATVTADGRPIAGPVDGIFYRGAFHFGSAPDSFRFRHIRRRPAVSATHLDGEQFSVTVHGNADEIDLRAPEHAGFRGALLDIYTPRYGAEWEAFLDSGPVYARIEPERMITFWMPAETD
jgi:hypothetical protein